MQRYLIMEFIYIFLFLFTICWIVLHIASGSTVNKYTLPAPTFDKGMLPYSKQWKNFL